ncbi:MAG: hybrid sensor histidine kinase/response regulator [Devosia sp.]|uniref:hybrid sensor histidine kinase/response regulator n=1 Tax=Devosia sp. TaxID=1871048 RepID=UPI002619A90F|nr:ATP-binding protein [Devosia sp.]MDB5587553.1 hybrid sensor histidine kinase/response regulator [Devosia sp.]
MDREPQFLSGASEMAQRIRAFDWSSSPLGVPETWPAGLQTLVQLLLTSKQPMFLAWGSERTWLYNDAFIPIAGRKHPISMGLPSSEVWAEAWSDLRPLFDSVFAGEAIHMTGFTVGLDRQGVVEDASFDFSYTPIKSADGMVEGLYGVCIETTGRIAADKAQLAMAVRERDRIFEMSPDLFAVATFDGMLTSINPAWSRRLGRSADWLLSTPFGEFIHPDDLGETGAVIAELQAGRAVHQFHVRLLAQDGTPIAFAWSAVPEAPGSGLFYTVGRDITEETAAAEELRLAQEALRQSQKMEAVGQLTGGLAHDFNNVLAGISGSLELMKTRLAQGRIADLDRYVTGAQGAAKRAAGLTQRLLAFSRRQTLDPKPTDLNRLISGMQDLIERSVGPAVQVETAAAGGLWTTFVDQGQLENAMLNLCLNARDAMPDGGKLTIESGNRWLDERAAKERGLPTGQYVSLCVSDTGTGMSKEVIDRAFDPFYTTKPTGQGTGLGLSMVYGFAGQSNGAVRIYSEIGKGTMVCIYLPRHQGDADLDDDQPEPTAAVRSSDHETILVVDDEPLVRMVAIEMLTELGYQVIEAVDGPSALKILQSDQPIDLLVTDVGLPNGMNGRQLADGARASRPRLQVLFITGYAENAVLNHGHLDPGMHVMTKPFVGETFARRVRDLTAKSS